MEQYIYPQTIYSNANSYYTTQNYCNCGSYECKFSVNNVNNWTTCWRLQDDQIINQQNEIFEQPKQNLENCTNIEENDGKGAIYYYIKATHIGAIFDQMFKEQTFRHDDLLVKFYTFFLSLSICY